MCGRSVGHVDSKGPAALADEADNIRAGHLKVIADERDPRPGSIATPLLGYDDRLSHPGEADHERIGLRTAAERLNEFRELRASTSIAAI